MAERGTPDGSGRPGESRGRDDRPPEPASAMFAVENRQGRFAVDQRALEALLARVASEVAPEDPRGATLRVVSDREIREMNRRYRRLDRPTDVLAFPASPLPLGVAPDEAAYLGDLVISADTAARQAAEAGRPLGAELGALAVHGLLHLFGYDHERDRGEMVRLERLLRVRHGLAGGAAE